MRIKYLIILPFLPGLALAQQPLSAIDWITEQSPATMEQPVITLEEPPVSDAVGTPQVSVTTLDGISPDAVGLLPGRVTGLPTTLWAHSSVDTLVELLRQVNVHDQPAMQSLLYTLLLAEAEPPREAGPAARMLQARIDKLIELGAADPALAPLERAGPSQPPLFQRWFDLALLSGDTDRACDTLRAAPHLSPGYDAQVYCSVLSGDWSSAAVLLDTATAVGELDAAQSQLLNRFLDIELTQDIAQLPPPTQPTVLQFRLYEAVGAPYPTAALPLAFAMVDLSGNAGWKAQIEAAERLARSGAISENRLLGFLAERRPSASGGIWDRVGALKRFDQALSQGSASEIGASLTLVWPRMSEAGLDVVFARLYGQDLIDVSLTDAELESLAYRISLLSPEYEAAAIKKASAHSDLSFASAVARGDLSAVSPQTPLQGAIYKAFTDPDVPVAIKKQLHQGQLGEIILRAIIQHEKGAAGDLLNVHQSLSLLRLVGLEDTARQSALQLLLRPQ